MSPKGDIRSLPGGRLLATFAVKGFNLNMNLKWAIEIELFWNKYCLEWHGSQQ